MGLLAQRQLAAIDLLGYDRGETNASSYWTAGMLCKASGLCTAQLQKLVRENIIAIEEIEVQRDPLLGRIIPASSPLSLTPDQQKALEQILGKSITFQREAAALPPERPQGIRATIKVAPTMEVQLIPPILLHGVTGSGKTEVYLQALAAIIAQGKRGIVLVPEIALTAQAIYRFAGRFPGRVAIIHGALSDGERYDEWRRIRAGTVDVVIGARSALFSPLPDLGMIVLDEEHEPAYKQSDRSPTYQARDAAIALGEILHIPVILGSATPSIESFYHAERCEYHLVELRHRVD